MNICEQKEKKVGGLSTRR